MPEIENPEPPYEGVQMPLRFRDMAYADLPPAMRQRVDAARMIKRNAD